MENKKTEGRVFVSEIIQSLTEIKAEFGDIKFFAQLPPNLNDNDYSIGVRQHKDTGIKEAFIETTPNMEAVLGEMFSDLMGEKSPCDGCGKEEKPPFTCKVKSYDGEGGDGVLITSDGDEFGFQFEGCGEAISIRDSNGKKMTQIPTSEIGSYNMDGENLEVATAAIKAITKK